jgi:hypothetical protein
VLELPLNLIEAGAHFGKATPRGDSVLSLAAR